MTAPDPDLCDHHATVLGSWRTAHPHETRRGFRRRCTEIARACTQCPPPKEPK